MRGPKSGTEEYKKQVDEMITVFSQLSAGNARALFFDFMKFDEISPLALAEAWNKSVGREP
jgi:hypothetical protein